MKTIILCRHAESKENVKIKAFRDGMNRIGNWSLPSGDQVRKSLSLLKHKTDVDVSPQGYEQIKKMSKKIKYDHFMELFQPELVCYSPLTRAKVTCEGIFGYRETDIELPCLTEMSPTEIFLFTENVKIRIKEFENWLDSRKEERIVVVGHSRYFKVMLGADEVMDNCSIIKCSFLSNRKKKKEDDEKLSGDDNPSVSGEASGRWKVEETLYTLKGIDESKTDDTKDDITTEAEVNNTTTQESVDYNCLVDNN